MSTAPMDPADLWTLWSSELSPFALKVEALLRHRGVPYRWLPGSGTALEAHRARRRRSRVVTGQLPLTAPEREELDEFPLVPFLFGPRGENLYDSTAIAGWLDRADSLPTATRSRLIPATDPALDFLVRLVDEAMDEVGLYVVHHNRWVVAARDNDAGPRLAREMRPLLGPFARLLATRFPARQVRRLPYLFSCADPADAAFADLPPRLRPPARPGFPPTHALLEQAFAGLLAAIEPILATRPFLFGERFTLADASVYGQLGMNRSDPSAFAWIRRDAPATAAWIDRLAAGEFRGERQGAPLRIDATLIPLLDWVGRVFVPLMQQNHDAWEHHRAEGETLFNERGFDRGRGLYAGTLLGHPFRNVAKTFQVRVWRDLRRRWDGLDGSARERIAACFPSASRLERSGTAPERPVRSAPPEWVAE